MGANVLVEAHYSERKNWREPLHFLPALATEIPVPPMERLLY
jgi:hypothetical protein